MAGTRRPSRPSSESRAIRLRVLYDGSTSAVLQPKVRSCVESLFPEIIARGIIDIINYGDARAMNFNPSFRLGGFPPQRITVNIIPIFNQVDLLHLHCFEARCLATFRIHQRLAATRVRGRSWEPERDQGRCRLREESKWLTSRISPQGLFG